jgi:hypothetical protein
VSKVSKHDGKEEGERRDRVDGGVHLAVAVDAVRVDEGLKKEMDNNENDVKVRKVFCDKK